MFSLKRVSAVNSAKWLESLTEPPLLQNCPAAQFLGSYFPDGVGLSPTSNTWGCRLEDSTGNKFDMNLINLMDSVFSYWAKELLSFACVFMSGEMQCLGSYYAKLWMKKTRSKTGGWVNMCCISPARGIQLFAERLSKRCPQQPWKVL